VIVHGDVKPENVTFVGGEGAEEEPRDVRLSGLCSAVVGSPLLDIYAVVFNCASPGEKWLYIRVARWYIFKPNNPNLGKFWTALE
jgi:hypothetical protein